MDVQGTIAVAGEGSGTLVPCVGCFFSFPAASSGYVVGLDGSGVSTVPFSLAWGTPGVALAPATMTIALTDDCFSGTVTPNVNDLTGTIAISGAVLVYNGVQTTATVNGTFTTQQLPGGAIVVVSVTLSAQGGPITVNMTVAAAKGLLQIAPLGDPVCPTTEPTNFTVSGTLLTAA